MYTLWKAVPDLSLFEKLKVQNNRFKMIPLLFKNVSMHGKSQERHNIK